MNFEKHRDQLRKELKGHELEEIQERFAQLWKEI